MCFPRLKEKSDQGTRQMTWLVECLLNMQLCPVSCLYLRQNITVPARSANTQEVEA